MLYDGLYWKLRTRKDKMLHLGFDYKDEIMSRTLSARMFSSNETFTTFITYINDIMYQLVEVVKNIKTFANIATHKYEKRLN